MNPPAPNRGTLRGVAALFDTHERKDLFRIAITFLMGTISTGFNKYFGETEISEKRKLQETLQLHPVAGHTGQD